jgi:hypothetical protein
MTNADDKITAVTLNNLSSKQIVQNLSDFNTYSISNLIKLFEGPFGV